MMRLRSLSQEIPPIRKVQLRNIWREPLTTLNAVAGSYFNRYSGLCDDNASSLNGIDLITISTDGVDQFARPD